MLGAHPVLQQGKPMWHFAVWAPNARAVSLIGSFNGWNRQADPMQKQFDGTWELRLPESLFVTGQELDPEKCLYKFSVHCADGTWHDRSDPYGFQMELRPNTASKLTVLDRYVWHDQVWIQQRTDWNPYPSPINIYEVHIGSWRREGSKKDGLGHAGSVDDAAGRMLTYRELAEQLIPYVKDMGYTHIELLPVMEHPLDMSWGYQINGFFAATSRYGTPEDLMYFIDRCHQAGVGVILDWVPAHFPKDESGLREFDGTKLYEHPDPKRGEMPQWGTCMFDMGRGEVRSFLLSSADFWLTYYHADGIRVDAVSSITYRDFCRNDGDWTPNDRGGNENDEGISFLQMLTTHCRKAHPGTLTIAEESHAFPGVTADPSVGGLGFHFKWNMGWMNDMLRYIKLDPIHRKYHHDKLTFSLFYAFSENYILPFSHDEVVHGKQSMLDKQPGDLWRKFAGLRALYGYTMAHPGKKLLFMGGEFGQFIEWRFDDQLDWFLLLYDKHPQLQACVRDLNNLYRSESPLYELDGGWDGFQWIQANDRDHSIAAFLRTNRKGESILCVTNFTPVFHPLYRMGMPVPGTLTEMLNTDRACYAGSDQHQDGTITVEKEAFQDFPCSVDLMIPPLSTVFYAYHKDPAPLSDPAAPALMRDDPPENP